MAHRQSHIYCVNLNTLRLESNDKLAVILRHIYNNAHLWLALVLLLGVGKGVAQGNDSFYTVRTFTMADGLAQEHFGDIVQDPTGYIWIGTWNGLARYDGYRFETFQPAKRPATTNRVLRLRIGRDGKLYCEMYNNSLHVFDRKRCKFVKTLDKSPKGWPLGNNFGYLFNVAVPDSITKLCPTAQLCAYDSHGNVWIKTNRSLAMATRHTKLYDYDIQSGDHTVRAIFIDHNGRKWTGNKDGSLMVDGHYVSATGHLSKAYTRLADTGIYVIRETRQGQILVGTKGDGLFVLSVNNGESFSMRHLRHVDGNSKTLSSNNIYDIAFGQNDKTYLATWGNGIDVLNDKMERTSNMLGKDKTKVRCLYVADNETLVAGTSDGLVAMNSGRTNRLLRGCDVMRIMVDGKWLYAAVYGAGLCKMAVGETMTAKPHITQYTTPDNTYANAVETAVAYNGAVWLFSKLCIARFAMDSGTYAVYDSERLGEQLYFTEAAPTVLADSNMIVGTEHGCIIFKPNRMEHREAKPRIVVTGVQFQGKAAAIPFDDIDTLHVKPGQRSVMLYVSTLDFAHTQKTGYKYRIDGVDGDWNYAVRSNAISYSGLRPGKHILRIRSCDDRSVWLDNERCVVIDVEPMFHETLLFRMLITLLCVAMVAVVAFTWKYIKRLHRQQRELEEYCHRLLSSTEKQVEENTTKTERPIPLIDGDHKELLDRFMALFRENIDNSDMSVQDYADQLSMSRSVFYRRIKTLTGCTPIELISRLRTQAAAQLFDEGERQVADVAYRTGFSDPKYFSKTFKKNIGMSPSEYIASLNTKD